MAISTMYPAKAGSPETTIVGGITAIDTSMTLYDSSVLTSAPGLCVIGNDSIAEVVSYTEISGNVVNGLIRGLGGTIASAWGDGTPVARNFTSFDHDRFILNIETLSTEKAPLASPALTGIPTAPTATAETDSTQIATTAFVHDVLDDYAPLASPALTGDPTAPTQAASDSSTKIATTAFVQGEIAGKAPLASPTFTGIPTAPTVGKATDTNQIATTAFVHDVVEDYAPLSSPALTGTPTAPTAVKATNTTRIATTAFVHDVADDYAPLASPALTGTPTAPTASSGTSTTQIATTAYVQGEVNTLNKQILYFPGQTVSVASSAQIMRIPASDTNSAITTDTVILSCEFTNPAYIKTNVGWQSYAGYVTFTGTCTTATTADVILGKKGN